MKNKAVTYGRVSSDRQEKEGFSLPAQEKLLSEYAKKNNIQVVETFFEAETAKKAGRKKFTEMIKFLKKNKSVRAILVEKTDRLYRNLKDYVTLDEIEGLEIHFVKEGTILSDKSKSQDKFMHGIRVLMAKNYIDNLSEEIKKGLKEKVEQGYCPIKAPIGYKNVTEKSGKRIILPDENDALYIPQIFEEFLIGNHTYHSLSEEMKRRGFFPKNKPCTKKTIEQIINNEFYTGVFVYAGYKCYNGKHKKLISTELFRAVQDKLRNRSPLKPRVHNLPYNGFIKCAHCGKYLSSERQRGAHNSGEYVYLKCQKCKMKYLKQEVFEDAFRNKILVNIHFTDEEIKFLLDITKELLKCEQDFTENNAEQMHKKIQLLKKRLSNLYNDKIDGIISEEMYFEKKHEWENELEITMTKYNITMNKSRTFLDDIENLSNLCKDAMGLYDSQSSEEKRKMMNLMLSNPIYDGSNLHLELKSTFAHVLKIKKLETRGVEPLSKMD